jgi:hypothetical protein
LPDLTGECTVNVPTPSTTDNCGGTVTVTTSGTLTYSGQGTNVITWVFTDDKGNSSTANQKVIVKDVTPPAVPVLADVTGQCSATATAPTTTDNCAGTVTGTTSDPLTYNTVGTHVIHWTFNDGNGNSSSANQNVIVTDTQAPTISGVGGSMTIECSAPLAFSTPSASDNCGAVTLTAADVTTAGSCAGSYSVTRTWTANDGHGNLSTASQTITVQDTLAPVLSGCPADVTVANLASVPAPATVTALDACQGNIIPVYGETTTTVGCGSTITRTWTATDACGHSASCTQVITVTGSGSGGPVISCPANIAVTNATGICGAVVTYTAPVGTDSCSGAPVATVQLAGLASGSTFPVGVTTNTFRATDSAGQTVTCSFTVTVTDTEKPTISGLPANIVVLPNAGQCTAVVSWTLPTAADNCAGATVSCTPASGSSFPLGTTTVNVTATDAAGNSTTRSFTVTVLGRVRVEFRSPLESDKLDNNDANGVDAAGTPEIVNLITAGSTVPHKIKLIDCTGADVTATANVTVNLKVTQNSGSYGNVSNSVTVATTYTGVGGTGGLMTLLDGHYQYNLKTTGFLADTDNDGKSSANDVYYYRSVVEVKDAVTGVVIGREDALLETR